jgi:5'-nucleotidase/UDP-sugar diphosphatase
MLTAFPRHGVRVVLNLGNHEPEFTDMAELVREMKPTGAIVVSDIVDRQTGQPFAPSSVRLRNGRVAATIVGFCTDRLSTFREAVRPELAIPEPVAWGRANLPQLLKGARIPVVLSHAGLKADRELLGSVPDGTLFIGAHDHLRLVHQEGRTVYVHSGSWNEFLTVASLRHDAAGANVWDVEQLPISTDDPADDGVTLILRETEKHYGAAEDAHVIGHTAHAYSSIAAERFVVAAVRDAAQVDAAFVGHTTFGGGLPEGDVAQARFDACVRFDGALCTGEIDGARLADLLAHANQTPSTPWSERRGEYLVAAGPKAPIDPARRYTIAVTDWIARNPAEYLGEPAPKLTPHPELRLKAIAAAALK